MATTQTFGVGPFTGVWDTGEPFDDATGTRLADATNVYFPNPEQGSGAYARPGINTPYSVTHGGNGKGQGAYTMRALDGTVYNFLFLAGKVWRVPVNLSSAPVDVTPTNVIISATARYIFATTLADEMIVSDGINKPWRASNLGSTPITATVIEQRTPTNLLSRGSTDTNLATAAFNYVSRSGGSLGTQATQAAIPVGTAIGALGTLPAAQWAAILVEYRTDTNAFNFTAAPASFTTGYGTEGLAIAALPARTASRWYVGYVTVQAAGGTPWVAGTDAFAGGATGTPAQTTNYYAGEGVPWSAFGRPVIYTGAVFFIAQQVDLTYARTTITWSEPNQPGVGYQQTDYDNAWTLTQTSAEPLYALQPTNDGLYYFRQLSIGVVAGAPGVNFQGTATHDVVSQNVGTVSPSAVAMAGNVIYFADQIGRPWRFSVGGTPEPIWRQCRNQQEQYGGLASGFEFTLVEPTLNVVVMGTWPTFSISDGWQFGRLYIFDAQTGTYFGTWQWSGPQVAGAVADSSGNPRLVFLVDTANPSIPIYYLGTPNTGVWTDGGAVPTINASTGWLGYDGVNTFRAVEARVMQETTTACSLTVSAVGGTGSTSTTRSPVGVTFTHTGRTVFPMDTVVGRGVRVVAAPTTATGQWKCYRVEVDLVANGRATVADY